MTTLAQPNGAKGPGLSPGWRERLAMAVLENLGPSQQPDGALQRILEAVVRETGLECAGLRLREGDDYPFFVFHGHSQEFVRIESSLRERPPDGAPSGLECLCGAVLEGDTSWAGSSITPAGSFVAGRLQAQAGAVRAACPRRFRGTCQLEGLETLALVPMREGGRTIGLLHLGDHRPELLGQDEVAFLERLGGSIAAVLARARAVATERALRESEERWRAVVQNEPECVKLLDREGRLLEMNPAGLAMIQAHAEEVFGGRASALVAPEDRAAFEEMVAGVFRGESRRLVFDMIGLRGRRLTLETTSVPLWDSPEHQRVTTLLGVTRDITARRQAETALREAAEDWVATFDALETGVLLFDARDRVARANRTAGELEGAESGVLVGCRVDELPAGQPWEAVREVVSAVRSKGGDLRQVRDAFGHVWDVEGTLMPARDGPARLVVTVRDVSRLAQLQESVRLSERMASMGALVAGVAHEVRNPLFAILANVDALGTVLVAADDVSDLLGAIRKEVARLQRLMEDLLDYGRPSAPSLGPEGLQPCLELALQQCREDARAFGVEVAWEPGCPSRPVLLDRGRLAQVFENLLRNAIQHSPRGGQVALRSETFEDDGRTWVRCRVCDRGPGFGEQDLLHVFDPFFTRRRGGTGLGLSIAQRIVEQHQGRIFVRNREGGGGCVILELPTAPEEPGARPVPVEDGLL